MRGRLLPSFFAGGVLTLAGNFSGNMAGTTGGVLDQIEGGQEYTYRFDPGAALIIDPAAVFTGNMYADGPRRRTGDSHAGI
jgi:hypothetical protein